MTADRDTTTKTNQPLRSDDVRQAAADPARQQQKARRDKHPVDSSNIQDEVIQPWVGKGIKR